MKSSQWGQRITHGTMTFAIGIGLTASDNNPHAFTYGYERLRFPSPCSSAIRSILNCALSPLKTT